MKRGYSLENSYFILILVGSLERWSWAAVVLVNPVMVYVLPVRFSGIVG